MPVPSARYKYILRYTYIIMIVYLYFISVLRIRIVCTFHKWIHTVSCHLKAWLHMMDYLLRIRNQLGIISVYSNLINGVVVSICYETVQVYYDMISLLAVMLNDKCSFIFDVRILLQISLCSNSLHFCGYIPIMVIFCYVFQEIIEYQSRIVIFGTINSTKKVQRNSACVLRI